MEETDRLDYIRKYEERLREFGYSPQTLGWGIYGRQEIRFAILAENALHMPESSVLDVGCGFADLYDFLVQRGWCGQYTGIDIVPGLLCMARELHPDLDLRELDITSDTTSLETYDFVIASGVLNAKLKVGDNKTHIMNVLRAMHKHARIAVCVDFLSTYVDFEKPNSWHTDPKWVLDVAKRLSRRVLLRHDYLPFEFALVIFQDDSISERNVFQAFESTLLG
ncbi:MAG: class I SAM-dependent methyltransferase [Chloroflexota bacterium]